MFGILKTIGYAILICGLGLAILRLFGGDPFAAINWALHEFWKAVEGVANIFSHSKTFQKATKD